MCRMLKSQEIELNVKNSENQQQRKIELKLDGSSDRYSKNIS